jgi:uncharacterized SAM-binding protein YcdF (DUF218 family)
MSFYINKIVAGFSSPIGVCLLLLAMAGVAALLKRRRMAWAVGILAFAWLWFWSTSLAVRLVAQPLDDCETVAIDDLPKADAVVILGGSMTVNGFTGRPEMYGAADRVWQGARIFNAGKANKVVLTGGGVMGSTVPLLVDFGVPQSAIVMFDDPRNTEEEAKRIKDEFGADAKVVLVTSAWHMRRALLLFRRAGIDVIPCAADYEMSIRRGSSLDFKELLPSADALMRNSYAVKEWVAHFCYRWFRR